MLNENMNIIVNFLLLSITKPIHIILSLRITILSCKLMLITLF